jgi:PadR family transcriptional regulator PadR
MPKTPGDLLYGTLDILVLKALSWEPMHGYALSTRLRDGARGAFELDDAALYKALYRLEDQGAVTADWGITENNRRAKYYHLTAAGRHQLRAEQAAWRNYATAVSRILRTA